MGAGQEANLLVLKDQKRFENHGTQG